MLWEITFRSGESWPVRFTDQIVHHPWSLMIAKTDRSLSADVPFEPTTHVKLLPGSTCQSKQLFQSPAPAGQECEDWKIVLSLRYSEGRPLILISRNAQRMGSQNCMWGGGGGLNISSRPIDSRWKLFHVTPVVRCKTQIRLSKNMSQ